MTEFVTVCNVDEVPDGESRSFDIGNKSIAVFNRSGTFSAIDDLCPHMGASLAEGDFDPETCSVTCPWHSWRFNVIDGAWADNPRIKTDVFEVRVIDNKIQIGIEPPKSSSKPASSDSADDVDSKSKPADSEETP